jgi:GH15 family glucan-1,4-alpha-glucosidase
MQIEDYGVIGDTQTAALVGRDGSIDWLCLPRFDSGACFAALLGDRSNGRWRLAPKAPARVERRYLPGTLVLETTFHTEDGGVRITDCMPIRTDVPDLVRVVEGLYGSVEMEMDLTVRPDYGAAIPWVRRIDGALSFVSGPDAMELRTDVPTRGENLSTTASFRVAARDRVPFVLTWHPSHEPVRRPPHTADRMIDETVAWWQQWSDRAPKHGRWADDIRSSLITLKALTYAPTGGIVAAPTTSLPEVIGGGRNWDYRYCWLRDATFTLQALLNAGYTEEAVAWRDWLLRAIAGAPDQLQIMYGVAGERRLTELELPWLAGYEASRPVRIGNGAAAQSQLDVPGEVMDALHQSRLAGIAPDPEAWEVQRHLLDWLESGLAGTRLRSVGGPRRAPPLRPLEGDVLGGLRPGRAGGGALRRRWPRRPVASATGRGPCRGVRPRMGPRSAHVHPVLWFGGARCQLTDDPAGRFPRRRRRPGRRHGRRCAAGVVGGRLHRAVPDDERIVRGRLARP